MRLTENRNAGSCEAFTRACCAPGAHVRTDEWKGYNGLEAAGYGHSTVCHKRNYVDPQTQTHTQKIESSWHCLKQWLNRHGYTRVQTTQAYVSEFCARRSLGFDAERIWRTLFL
jgi:hypothetical protein